MTYLSAYEKESLRRNSHLQFGTGHLYAAPGLASKNKTLLVVLLLTGMVATGFTLLAYFGT